MPTQRTQFGKRGLNQPNPVTWTSRQSGGAAASATMAYPSGNGAYARAGAEAAQFAGEMSFSAMGAVTHVLGLFFSFNGRIGRLGYWGLGTFNLAMMIAIVFAYFAALNIDFDNREEAERILANASLLSLWLILLPFSVSNISLQVRRFHDRDVSALWMFVWFIPIIGIFPCLFQGIANAFFAGTRGPNRFDTPASQAHVFD
ncbi:DUF805 domain-containing protein [Roseibium sp.]|uniref:DUF805 domain-containing protein n=1 Tax=Roseibium sp. TaxID=1936156 RepID=UPI003D09E67E